MVAKVLIQFFQVSHPQEVVMVQFLVMVVLVDQVVVVEEMPLEIVDQVIVPPLVHLKEILVVEDFHFLFKLLVLLMVEEVAVVPRVQVEMLDLAVDLVEVVQQLLSTDLQLQELVAEAVDLKVDLLDQVDPEVVYLEEQVLLVLFQAQLLILELVVAVTVGDLAFHLLVEMVDQV
jgi:hypothetical protein